MQNIAKPTNKRFWFGLCRVYEYWVNEHHYNDKIGCESESTRELSILLLANLLYVHNLPMYSWLMNWMNEWMGFHSHYWIHVHINIEGCYYELPCGLLVAINCFAAGQKQIENWSNQTITNWIELNWEFVFIISHLPSYWLKQEYVV